LGSYELIHHEISINQYQSIPRRQGLPLKFGMEYAATDEARKRGVIRHFTFSLVLCSAAPFISRPREIQGCFGLG
jgi:hypothetical protein